MIEGQCAPRLYKILVMRNCKIIPKLTKLHDNCVRFLLQLPCTTLFKSCFMKSALISRDRHGSSLLDEGREYRAMDCWWFKVERSQVVLLVQLNKVLCDCKLDCQPRRIPAWQSSNCTTTPIGIRRAAQLRSIASERQQLFPYISLHLATKSSRFGDRPHQAYSLAPIFLFMLCYTVFINSVPTISTTKIVICILSACFVNAVLLMRSLTGLKSVVST
jgi:hypothetical protein